MKQVYLMMAFLGLMSTVTGVSKLMPQIAERGLADVNYGMVIFPALLCVFSFWMYKRRE